MEIVEQSTKVLWPKTITDANVTADDVTIAEEIQRVIEKAGRTAHRSEEKITSDSYNTFIDKIIRRLHHNSVIEHGIATIEIITDRGITHELVRHRLCTYTQESTRWCAYKDSIRVIKPSGIKDGTPIYRCWLAATSSCETAYLTLIKNNISPQIARSVLPTCLATKIIVTANLRQWRHILELRLHKTAHPQFRELALMIFLKLAELFPICFKASDFTGMPCPGVEIEPGRYSGCFPHHIPDKHLTECPICDGTSNTLPI